MSAAELQKYDIVITTYQSVTREHETAGGAAVTGNKKRKTGDRALYDVKWKVLVVIHFYISSISLTSNSIAYHS